MGYCFLGKSGSVAAASRTPCPSLEVASQEQKATRCLTCRREVVTHTLTQAHARVTAVGASVRLSATVLPSVFLCLSVLR